MELAVAVKKLNLIVTKNGAMAGAHMFSKRFLNCLIFVFETLTFSIISRILTRSYAHLRPSSRSITTSDCLPLDSPVIVALLRKCVNLAVQQGI